MMYANYWGTLPVGMHDAWFGSLFGIFMIPLVFWSLFWKGWALWVAAHEESKGWFAALLVLNTAGILEIIYIFLIAKKNTTKVNSISKKKK